MKYTKEQLMPKRYSENRPLREGATYYIYTESFYGNPDWSLWHFYDNSYKPIWDKHVIWYIDIPDAPDEVRPLAYPENKPSENGLFIFHHIFGLDKWFTGWWNGRYFQRSKNNSGKLARDVDYFIDVRLDKEEDVREMIWNTDKLCVEKSDTYASVILWHPKIPFDKICTPSVEFTALCRHWLDLQGKPEPEIAPCPNPECKSVEMEVETLCFNDFGVKKYIVSCPLCGYSSPRADTETEAIRLHNGLGR
jgi:hypothetical protein